MFKQGLNFKEQLQNLRNVRGLTMGGLFIALYVVLTYFNIRITDNLQIRFFFLALAAAGLYGGPIFAAFIGAAGDILGMLMTAGQGSSMFFGFTLSYALLGFGFGLILYRSKITVPKAIAAGVWEFIISMTLNTLWLYLMYGTPFPVLLASRLIKSAIVLAPNCLMLFFVLQAFERVFHQLGKNARA